MIRQSNEITLLRATPTVTLFCHSFWHLIWKYIWHVFADILFSQSMLPLYLTSILTSYLPSFLASVLTFSVAFYLAFFLILYLAFILTLFLASILAFILTFSLTWALPDLNRKCQISVALRTEIWSSPLRPGGAHWYLELGSAFEVRQCPLQSGARRKKEKEVYNSDKI